ncbi:MAG: homocysteine S-methyltransferase family protein [Actinobacteria bacterium]|nr:homocysteine S-methyltransferase family protein [Actinomycetota bacterium]
MSIESNVAELAAADKVLTDGGIETWIDYKSDYKLTEVGTVGMLDTGAGRALLVELESRYINAAVEYDLPIVIGTPSWHGADHRLQAAGLPSSAVERLNRSAVWLTRGLRRQIADGHGYVAGVMGPFGDGYDPGAALDAATAQRTHRRQADALAAAGADFLFAVPLPAVSEAVGICQAMAATGAAYVPSFLLNESGRLPDGTALGEAIGRVLDEVERAPLHISISCLHPRVFVTAFNNATDLPGAENLSLVAELKANASDRSRAELSESTELHADPPEDWAAQMMIARETAQLRIVGGCCGTDEAHIAALARLLSNA